MSKKGFIIAGIFTQVILVVLAFFASNDSSDRWGEAVAVVVCILLVLFFIVGNFITYALIPRRKNELKQKFKVLSISTLIFWPGLVLLTSLVGPVVSDIAKENRRKKYIEKNQLYAKLVNEHFTKLSKLNSGYTFISCDSIGNNMVLLSPQNDTLVVSGFDRAKYRPALNIRVTLKAQQENNDSLYWINKGLEVTRFFLKDSIYEELKNLRDDKITFYKHDDNLYYLIGYRNATTQYFFMHVTKNIDKTFLQVYMQNGYCKNCEIDK